MLVYLAREWGAVSTQELGRRFHRDPSMISRLASRYAMQRDGKAEAHLSKALNEQVNTHA
jgi:hypothetical protein